MAANTGGFSTGSNGQDSRRKKNSTYIPALIATTNDNYIGIKFVPFRFYNWTAPIDRKESLKNSLSRVALHNGALSVHMENQWLISTIIQRYEKDSASERLSNIADNSILYHHVYITLINSIHEPMPEITAASANKTLHVIRDLKVAQIHRHNKQNIRVTICRHEQMKLF